MTDTKIAEPDSPVDETVPPAATVEPEPEPPAAEPVPPGPDADPPATWTPPKRRRGTVLVILLLAIAALVAVLYAWGLPPFTSATVSTDNAYVRGRTAVIAPQVSGYVVEVRVRDYQRVRRGDVLARIDDRIYRARVAQAEAAVAARLADLANSDQARAARLAGLRSRGAELANARAQLQRAQADNARTEELSRQGWVTRRDRDRDLASLRQTEAAVQQALAGGEIARQDVRTVEVNRGALTWRRWRRHAPSCSSRESIWRTRSSARRRTAASARSPCGLANMSPTARTCWCWSPRSSGSSPISRRRRPAPSPTARR
jgi:hypothetical protein